MRVWCAEPEKCVATASLMFYHDARHASSWIGNVLLQRGPLRSPGPRIPLLTLGVIMQVYLRLALSFVVHDVLTFLSSTEEQRTEQIALILAATRHRSLDELLSQLDDDIELSHGDETLCVGPFGVLRVVSYQDHNNTQATHDGKEGSASAEWDDFMLGDFPVDKSLSGLEVGFLDSPNDAQDMYGNDTGRDLSFLSPLLGDSAVSFFMSPMQSYVPNEADLQLLDLRRTPTPRIQRYLSVDYAPDLMDVDVPTIRLLLARYEERMIPTFAPVQAQGKSAWERVHIPKVNETLGEILVKGNSTDVKCALLFAVLSAASYHLDAVGGGPPHHTMKSWRDMASIFRQRAKTRLLASLRSASLLARSRSAYEEMLLAILSMVTVCVVSGDMVESHAYIHNVEQFIESRRSPHFLKYTSTRMLHSIFLYLWTLQAGVREFGNPGRPQDLVAQNQNLNRRDPTAQSDVWRQLIPVVDETDQNDDEENSPINSNSRSRSSSSGSQSTVTVFEQVYSVSEPLFRLIGRVKSFACAEGTRDDGTIDSSLNDPKKVAEIENAICSWRNDIAPADAGDVHGTNGGGNVRYHFQNAIHSALLVYFYKCVRGIDTYAVQPHVEKTLSHLQLYTEAKRRSSDQSSSICWPGFVAACEALDQDIRHRFAHWFLDETARTGIRMFATAGTAVKRVWHARDRSNNRNLPWSKILQSDNILDQLVLS
ncbi:hypothetical protein PV08_04023 [Exophiala spinifera]|uniref:Transcription factor domain-containing protein n=1 Tax=Exophiala spinifera TaxID=91928 RepID=A0A0D2BCY8_9EURO|nr:uncharacterized protein PV08_04023 [Exophiala spinifera]KIW16833.1 hypothetical protein PV08_04023 [Exophiala spinifera]